jgi:hypothetical protein
MSETKYPELEKMKATRAEADTLTRFVDWLEENDMRICKRVKVSPLYRGSPYESISESFEKLFARFFEVDLDKIEAERRQILDAQRELLLR